MATSAVSQSIMASPVSRLHNATRLKQIAASCHSPRPFRNSSLRVRCTSGTEINGLKEESSPAAASIPPSPPVVEPTTAPPPPKVEVSTKFGDVLAFSGPAPERINGRLAMIGFASAMFVELNNGEGFFAQIANGGGQWFIGTTVVLTIASLIPFFKGVTVQRVSDGIMTPEAEIWNGRLAMLGLLGLVVTEYVKGAPIIV